MKIIKLLGVFLPLFGNLAHAQSDQCGTVADISNPIYSVFPINPNMNGSFSINSSNTLKNVKVTVYVTHRSDGTAENFTQPNPDSINWGVDQNIIDLVQRILCKTISCVPNMIEYL